MELSISHQVPVSLQLILSLDPSKAWDIPQARHSFPPVSWHSLYLVTTMPPHVRDDQGSSYQQGRAPHCKLAGTRWSSSKVSFHSQLPPVKFWNQLPYIGYSGLYTRFEIHVLGVCSLRRSKRSRIRVKNWTEIHLQKRPHPIPGKQRSCAWPSQLAHFRQGDTSLCSHPSTSWSSQWI